MKRMWKGSAGNEKKYFQNAAEELEALKEASSKAAWVMNDEIDRAQRELSTGTTPFHKLAYGASLFWQSVLAFDKQLMTNASNALAEAEAASAEYKKAATSGKGAACVYHSEIYPDGSEFALCEAQSQLLGAILGVLKESWLESLTGLNKLRKAYFVIQGLHESEKKYLKLHPIAARSTPSVHKINPPPPLHRYASVQALNHNYLDDGDDSDDEFFDALEVAQPNGIIANGFAKGYSKFVSPSMADLSITSPPRIKRTESVLSNPRSESSIKSVDAPADFRLVTSDPMELYVHSGVSMCWGILQIVLGLLPPAFRHLLAMFKFKGDRDNGLRILWEDTSYKDNIFGSIASLVVLLYNNIAVSLADIKFHDAVPEAKLHVLLGELRALYPSSRLWLIEEARMLYNNRQIEKAVQTLSYSPKGNTFIQLYGLSVFEKGLNQMFLHRFDEAAMTFLHCTEVNAWSHGMYFYIAACCYIELYRDYKRINPATAKQYADTAVDLLKSNNVSTLVRKKALLGQQLPFDSFVTVKLDKWEARAKAKNCEIPEVVGVSPIEEFCYFWTGYRRMTSKNIQVSLDRLAANEALPEWQDQPADERAGLAVLKAVGLRVQGRFAEAKDVLQNDVFCYTTQQIKACPNPITYPLPIGHYEMGVCLWMEAGGENGNANLLRECKSEVETAYKWEHWDLEDRLVVKLMNARETFTKLGI